MALTEIPSELSSTPSIVDNGNATAITIGSDESVALGGNFIVGATSAFASSSFCVDPTGLGQFRRDGTPLIVRRDGSLGDLISFEDDGATVGSIGTGYGLLTIGTGTGNLVFENALVAPCSDSSVGSSNGVVDLGASSRRFKDLYLSGGAYLGGTAAANKLEDYETGTWTPVIAGCTISIGRANYVKIGGLVKLDFNVVITGNDNSGSPMLMTGVPFTASSANSESVGSPMLRYFDFDSGATDVVMYHYSRTPTIEFYEVSDDSNWSLLRRDQIASNSAAIIGTITITVD